MKKLILVLPALLVFSGFLFTQQEAQATFNICQIVPQLCSPLPSFSPSPSPEPSAEPSIEPSPEPSEEPSETPLPSEEPSSTPSATPSNNGFSQPGAAPQPEVCRGADIKSAPTIHEVKRINDTTVRVSWTPSDQNVVKGYKVFYGPDKDNLVWNVIVKDLTVDLGNLPKDQDIAVQVVPTDDCLLGIPSTVVPLAPPATGRGGN